MVLSAFAGVVISTHDEIYRWLALLEMATIHHVDLL
jgi:hypothetical protein